MITNVVEVLKDNLYIIEHVQADVTVTYDKKEFDKKVQSLVFVNEYYDYNKPHKVVRENAEAGWRLVTCMFGVCEFTILNNTIELSRQNKKQLLIRPNLHFKYFNISGKSVVHVKATK